MSQNIALKSNNLVFRISPIITITLLTLYIALTIPFPFLIKVTSLNIPVELLWFLIFVGAVIILSVLSEKVVLNDQEIKVCYPFFVSFFLRRNWSLSWLEISDLKMRTTGQGGIVYYFITQDKNRAYLLPMRIAGFKKMLQFIQLKTDIDTKDIRPLSQPWMYFLLFIFSLFLLLIDTWTIFNTLMVK